MFSSKQALSRIQAVSLIVIIAVATFASFGYVFLSAENQNADTIKIGVIGDLDMMVGESAFQGALLAAEQINSEGGLIGRNIEIIGADSDSVNKDVVFAITALKRLITHDNVDYIISSDGGIFLTPYQETIVEHKKILFGVRSIDDTLTQKVLDDYENYKYFFRVFYPNTTSSINGLVDSILTLREYTGFNKVAYLAEDFPSMTPVLEGFDYYLPEVHGFELVYKGKCPPSSIDFSSYFAAIEESGAEILFSFIPTQSCLSFIEEWYNRQSPFVIWGNMALAQDDDFWELTDGKCNHISTTGVPVTSGYPLTSKTLEMREAYINRWNDVPDAFAAAAYDAVRFILYDAIKKAGTTETETIIKSLEATDIETSLANRFVFTSSHDVMVGEAGPNKPDQEYMLLLTFQWQDGKMVPVYPREIMEEAGTTYTFPDWSGPWD